MVYIDQVSQLGFVWSSTADETIEGKIAFEKYAQDRGIKVLNYQANNSIFKAHKWVNVCHSSGQGLSFTGVNAHPQNRIAEWKI
jgi:hypothetical protein